MSTQKTEPAAPLQSRAFLLLIVFIIVIAGAVIVTDLYSPRNRHPEATQPTSRPSTKPKLPPLAMRPANEPQAWI